MSDLYTRQVAAIEKWLAVFHSPGEVVELRALRVQGKRAVCEVHGDLAALARRAAELDGQGAQGTYFTLNPLCPDLVGSRASCRAADVVERHWLPLDIDPYRPKDLSSTEAELQAAWTVLDRCRGLLDGAGLGAAVVGHSGNGWHLCYPILLPNDDASQDTIKQVLKGLHARCGDALTTEEKELLRTAPLPVGKAKVEVDVHDAPRIWKLYGTRARKGVSTPERPHRWTRLVEGGTWDKVVARANTMALTGLLASWRFAEDARRGRPQTSAESYAQAALRQELAAIAGATVGERNNTLNRAAFSLGQLVGPGALSRGEIETALSSAAQAAGLGEVEARATIKSGIEAGLLQPRDLSGVGTGRAGRIAGEPANPPPDPNDERIIRFAGEIAPRRVSWLWPWRIPDAKLTTFAGQTGQGKTLVACDIVARVTRGGVWPDGKPGGDIPGQVLFITGDDDFDDTLVPRLIDAGADLDHVVFLSEPAQAAWSMAALATLDQAIEQAGGGVRLVVIDPPTSFLMGIDDNKNAELRAILTPFKNWARRQGIAVILITHVNKGGAHVDAMMRVMGSVAWVTGVRAAYLFAADPEQEGRQLFLTLKNNLGPKAKTLAYRIIPGEWTGRIEWLGEVDTTADEAVSKTKKEPKRGAIASEWLVDRFRENLTWKSDDLFSLARQEGISKNAIYDAKRILDLPKARKITAQDGSISYAWWVPADWPQLSHLRNGGTPGHLDNNPLPD